MKVLIVTSEWPTIEHPEWVPYITDQIEDLESLGINVNVFHFRGNSNPFNYFKAWKNIHSILNSVQVDIIHAHWGYNGLLCLPCKVPLVITFHGSDLQGYYKNNGKYDYFKSFFMKFSSMIAAYFSSTNILVSKSLLKKFPKWKKERIKVVPCGIDTSLFTPISKIEARNKLKLSLTKKYILFPANPNLPVKRFDLAMKIYEQVSKEIEVGLLTLSNVPHELVPYYMNASDVLLLTSKHEGSPMVIKEALACNLPIISVNVGDIYDRVANIQGCYISLSDNPEELANLVKKVLFQNIEIDGRSHIEEISRKKSADRLFEIYQSVLKSNQ
jgi:glycosyltransferase involved in cell wall biosynthesis